MTGHYTPSRLGFDTLTARSVALSALLGEHPPELAGRALVALGRVLGIGDGTMRTALSRLVRSGDVTVHHGTYSLGPRLLDRQRAQDSGRDPVPLSWDGTWWFVIVDAERRPLAERRDFRARMRYHRLGELRPDVWLRPANLPSPTPDPSALVVHGSLSDRDPLELVSRCWDLRELTHSATTLLKMIDDTLRRITDSDPGDVAALHDASLLTVAVSRYLLREPRLPPAMLPSRSQPDDLRAAYDQFERAYRQLRSSFLTTATQRPGSVTALDRCDQHA